MAARKAARKVAQPRKSDERVIRAIRLLEVLSSVEGAVITEHEALKILDCTSDELTECMELISTLADRTTGARARVFRDHGDVVLEGDDAQLVPLRLNAGEGTVLGALLDDLALDDDTRQRLGAALLPPGTAGAAAHIAAAPGLGAHFPLISRALDKGCACRILYRAQHEHEPSERTIVPLRTEIVDGGGYLIAFDQDKQRTRRYRLDRIAHITLLDDRPTVTASADDHLTMAQSLERGGETVQLALDETEEVPTWAGIEDAHREGGSLGPWRITLKVSARPWLFDQVLSYGGRLRILGPAEVIRSFGSYADKLTAPRDTASS